MKIRGKTISGPNIETIVIPRGDGEPIVLYARAILSNEKFEKICPEPQPPVKILATGAREPEFKHPAYIAQMQQHAARRMAWIVIESISIPENELEWDRVELNDPSTWPLWEQDMQEAGFSTVEIQRIQVGCYNANCLSEAKVEEARRNFQRGQEEALRKSSGQGIEPNSL